MTRKKRTKGILMLPVIMKPTLLLKIPKRQKNKHMRMRKVLLTCLAVWFIAPAAFCQTEILKSVTNDLAFYKQKKDLKYLSAAQTTVDSVISAAGDTLDVERNVYKVVVYSSIL